MNDVLSDLRASNPTYQSIKLPSTFTTRERMEMIEEDFENCISHNIMSKAAILRQKRRHKGLLNAYEGHSSSTLIEGAAIDSLASSLNLLRRLDPPAMLPNYSIQDVMGKIAEKGARRLDDHDLHRIFCTEEILAKEHGDGAKHPELRPG